MMLQVLFPLEREIILYNIDWSFYLFIIHQDLVFARVIFNKKLQTPQEDMINILEKPKHQKDQIDIFDQEAQKHIGLLLQTLDF